jgi:uroporphyrin-III C-methyltransferase/precorrin-2 dehydrogenase/sirohydrochlorin ferrochelatase
MIETSPIVVHEPRVGRGVLDGAGPDDPQLLRLKAGRALEIADVVLDDNLVGDGVLTYARRDATLVAVGKRRGQPSVRPTGINAVVNENARAARVVVRLKRNAECHTTGVCVDDHERCHER